MQVVNKKHKKHSNGYSLSRREFLRLSGLNAAAIGFPGLFDLPFSTQSSWPTFVEYRFPEFVRQILQAMPVLDIDDAGYLNVVDHLTTKQVPLMPTIWNMERQRSRDRLETQHRLGIVVHWFGNDNSAEMSLDGYMRGFNALRPVFNYETRTSAHFLVGSSHPGRIKNYIRDIGIVQMQKPDVDGVPFLGSHLQDLDYSAHRDKKQYFVRAYYQLAHDRNENISILQDWFDSVNVIDPNLRTIAIEVSGNDFDNPQHLPDVQKIANTTGLIWAIMKRYHIRATDLLGHHEIQLGKSDPGKIFMSMLRFLIGILAVREGDPKSLNLVFGDFISAEDQPIDAVKRYFNFVRNYLVLVGTPKQVYQWEATTNFWLAYDVLKGRGTIPTDSRSTFSSPVLSAKIYADSGYLSPHNHEGADFNLREQSSFVRLISSGICLFAGDTADPHWGKIALFRHRETNGAEIVAVYAHLTDISDLEAGSLYPQRFPVGNVQKPNSYQDAYLHMAIAYGATWDTDLKYSPVPPKNAGSSWILPRYLDPVSYIDEQSKPLSLKQKGIYYE